MLKELKYETNKTVTENGCIANKSTFNGLLDLFAQGGAMRNRDESDILKLFNLAIAEDESLAVKMAFYLRDITEGQGERRLFRVMIKHLASRNSSYLERNIQHIPSYGRWDDMFVLIGTRYEDEIAKIIKEQIKNDSKSETPSLLGKWLPSCNASSKETKKLAKKIVNLIGTNERDYRKTLSSLRGRIKLLETTMSEKRWSDIEYDKLPSKAGMKYKQAFFRNDGERYKDFIDSLSKGEKKINVKALYPYEIVEKCMNDYTCVDESKLYDGMWNNLPDYTEGKYEDSIAVVDVSGSMSGTPVTVAISLGMYLAERNKGAYHNHFITFSDSPQLVEIKGNNIVDKVKFIENSEWGYDTDLEKVFDLILNVAIKNKLKQEELVKKLYIFSDMEFNEASKDNKSILKVVKKKFKKARYELPKIVFWNLDARNEVFPCTVDDSGVQLVSGFSPSIFKQLMKDEFKSGLDLMLEVLNSERYKDIM